MAIVGKNTKPKATGFFEGCRFVVELGVISQTRKKELFLSIESNGGTVDFVISKKTTHVITNEAALSSYKLKSAHTHGCSILSEDYLAACVDAGRRVDEWQYLFIGETPAKSLGNFKDSTAYVSTHVARAFANVSAVMNVVYPARVNEAVEGAVLNIAALCAGLGARIPAGKFPLKPIVNNLYNNVIDRKPEPQSIIPTPMYREVAPKPTSLASPFTRPAFPSVKPLSSLSSTSSSSSSSFSSKSPVTSIQSTKPSSALSPVKPSSTQASSSYFSFSSSRPSTTPYFSFSSRPLSLPSATPASSAVASSNSAASKPAPLATKAVSYSYAQYEAERRKKREEEKAQKEEESGSVLREREARRKEEEDARKKAMEEKRLELLERRKQEDEERKQKNREITEAREKKIAEERKKREQALERLKQKAPTDLLTSAFFQQWDAEENNKKMREEWAAYQKQMEETRRKEEEKERAARERADRLFLEKERKIQEREEQEKLAVAERAAEKIRRREEYENNKNQEALQKKQEFEARQAKLLAEFVKRQERRAKQKAKLENPVPEKNYDDCRIFIGGIKTDDIKAAKFKSDLERRVTDERFNSVLRFFDQFGEVHARKVVAAKGHCFITFKTPEQAAQAVLTMKDHENRKREVDAQALKHKERNMNPLCTPHPQFYARAAVPNKKRVKQLAKKRGEKIEDDSEDEDDGGGEFTEVAASKRSAAAANWDTIAATNWDAIAAASPAAPVASSTPSSSSFARVVPAAPSSSSSPSSDPAPAPVAERPVRIREEPYRSHFSASHSKLEEIDLHDFDSFPTTANPFCTLDDDDE